MLLYLILLFTAVPIAELYLLIKIGQHIGAFNTVFIVLATGVFGAVLARMEGFVTLTKIQQDLQNGIMPTGKLIDGVFILVGGILLITPGLLTDIIGFLFIIPFTRHFFKTWLKAKLQDKLRDDRVVTVKSYSVDE